MGPKSVVLTPGSSESSSTSSSSSSRSAPSCSGSWPFPSGAGSSPSPAPPSTTDEQSNNAEEVQPSSTATPTVSLHINHPDVQLDLRISLSDPSSLDVPLLLSSFCSGVMPSQPCSSEHGRLASETEDWGQSVVDGEGHYHDSQPHYTPRSRYSCASRIPRPVKRCIIISEARSATPPATIPNNDNDDEDVEADYQPPTENQDETSTPDDVARSDVDVNDQRGSLDVLNESTFWEETNLEDLISLLRNRRTA
ncbi:hypothetical protein QBC42DRAFT_252962 [Cladorrhinum samala]|uniref:Uncharacterized protein n=1 Tax=Cladorrhinum samala TaxID=585594 RepID=A0AAV9HLV4_9PEZI|nr:hypothetical protein QBC42DRAFT_252962 [Cladorrhinum samala]